MNHKWDFPGSKKIAHAYALIQIILSRKVFRTSLLLRFLNPLIRTFRSISHSHSEELSTQESVFNLRLKTKKAVITKQSSICKNYASSKIKKAKT